MDGQIDGFEPFHLVAQPCGFFELQIFRSFAHVGAQAVEDCFEVATLQGRVDLCGDAVHVDIALVEARQDVIDVLLHSFGCDPMFNIIGNLFLAATVCLANGALHRAGDFVGIHDHAAIGVARCATDCLDERGFGAQKTLFVGVQNGNKAALGNVEALTQKVDPDQYIERAKAQIT